MPQDEYEVEKARGSKLPLVSQEKALAELHETIELLRNRLGAVLTPEPNKEGSMTATDAAAPMQSPLADTLDTNNSMIRRATLKISNIIDRLEC